jgi:hypothetical protein
MQLLLCVAEPGDNLLEIRVADDHQIHVAIGTILLGGNGTINKSHFDTVFQWRQRLTQDIADSGSL